MNKLPVAATELIPHRGRMLLIEALTDYSEETGSARAAVDAAHLFLTQNGELNSVALTELIAQTAAAHSGYKALSADGTPMSGFLVGVKDLRFLDSVHQGDRLTIRIHRDFQMEQVTFLSGKVLRGATLLAEGVLKLYEMPEAEAQTREERRPTEKILPFTGWNNKQRELAETSEINREILRYCSRFQRNGNEVSAEFAFGESFAGFNGHFPGNPIVPGVMLLKTGQLVAELAAEEHKKLCAVQTAKFAKTILPGETVRCSLQINETKVKCQIKAQDALCAKFSFILE